MTPKVSIVILNYNHPEIINVCLNSLTITTGVDYEVVVVDNASTPDVVEGLRQHLLEERIDVLIESPVNTYFAGGNNLGAAAANPESEYILLLNSDVGFLRPDWLTKMIGWAEGTTVSKPTIWGLKPTIPAPGPYDIISIGWSHDVQLSGHARAEGWCLLLRHEWWRDLSTDLPFHGGVEEMIASVIREGAKCGVLWNYSTYLVHLEGGSGATHPSATNARAPEMEEWFKGLHIETLDFKLDCWPKCGGPGEHLSYTEW